jgi:prevent-host-death family protein
MATRVTATEASRRLSDFLNRARYRGETFVIVRNGEEVGRLVPPPAGPRPTLRDLASLVRELPAPDDRFSADLERIRAEQPEAPGDPWES